LPGCQHTFPADGSLATLSVVIYLNYRFFFLPAFHFGRYCHFGFGLVRLFFEIFLLAWGSKTRFGFGYLAPGAMLVFPGLGCFFFCGKFISGDSVQHFVEVPII
jgi:hypothetical protein